jgi:hypothetical protein
MTITEMPIKKYFTFITPHTFEYALNDLTRTEYREVKLRQNQIENYLHFGHSSISEFWVNFSPTGANVRLIFWPYKSLFFMKF